MPGINLFEGYIESLNKYENEQERLLKLKDRSICPLCHSKIFRNETDKKLIRINRKLEKLEIKKRKYNIKINEEKLKNDKL